jgi:hypothetical protein
VVVPRLQGSALPGGRAIYARTKSRAAGDPDFGAGQTTVRRIRASLSNFSAADWFVAGILPLFLLLLVAYHYFNYYYYPPSAEDQIKAQKAWEAEQQWKEAERQRIIARKDKEQTFCRLRSVCSKFAEVRQACATAGNYKLCVEIKMGADAMPSYPCMSDGTVDPTVLYPFEAPPHGWLAALECFNR